MLTRLSPAPRQRSLKKLTVPRSFVQKLYVFRKPCEARCPYDDTPVSLPTPSLLGIVPSLSAALLATVSKLRSCSTVADNGSDSQGLDNVIELLLLDYQRLLLER